VTLWDLWDARLTAIPSSPLPPVPAGAVPAANPAAIEQTAQTISASPQPQPISVPESDPVLNALQNVAAAETALAQSVNAALPALQRVRVVLGLCWPIWSRRNRRQDLPAPVQAAILDILALRSPA